MSSLMKLNKLRCCERLFKTCIKMVTKHGALCITTVVCSGSQGERRAAAADGRTAQLSRVYFRGAFSIVQNHKPKNFFRVHEAYVRPEYVLEHDNITLHGITENEVGEK